MTPIIPMNIVPDFSEAANMSDISPEDEGLFGKLMEGDAAKSNPEGGEEPETDAAELPAVTVIPPVYQMAEEPEIVLEMPLIEGEDPGDSLLAALHQRQQGDGGMTVGELRYLDPQEQVTDFLEGNDFNQDIAPPEPEEQPVTAPVQTGRTETVEPRHQEALARMPEMTGETPVMTSSESEGASDNSFGLETGDLYPLENVSDESETGADFAGQLIDISPQRTAGTQALESLATQPVTQENLFDTLVETMTLMESESETSMQLQLKPEHLGKVSIVLTLDDSGVRARIAVEDQNVRNVLGAQLNALTEGLAAKGVALTAIEVVETGIGDMNFDRPGSSDKEPAQDNGRGRPVTIDAAEPDDPIDIWEGLEDYMEEGQAVSSVEYRA